VQLVALGGEHGPGGVEHGLGGEREVAVEIGLEPVGLAAEEQVRRQHAGLARDRLDAAVEAALEAGGGRLDLVGGGRGVARELVELGVDGGHHLVGGVALGGGGLDDEVAAELAAVLEAPDVAGDALLLDQGLRQAGVLARAQQVGHGVHLGVAGRVERGAVPPDPDLGVRHVVGLDLLGRRGEHDRIGGQRRGLLPRGDPAELLGDERLGGVGLEVADHHQGGVVGDVPGAEEVLHIVQRGVLKVLVRADRRVMVGVALGVQGRHEVGEGLAVGRVLVALAALVAHHLALVVELCLVEHREQVAHPVRLHEQRQRELVGGHRLEVVGAVGVGGAVDAGADGLQGREVLAGAVVAALEHQVLKQVRKAGEPLGLVFGSHMVPELHVHDGGGAVGGGDDVEAVVEGVALVRNGQVAGEGGTGHGREQRAPEDPATDPAERSSQEIPPG